MQGMESYASFEGTILEVRRTYIRAVFSRAASDRMEARPARGTWRIDRYSPETTYQRQLKVKQECLCMASCIGAAWSLIQRKTRVSNGHHPLHGPPLYLAGTLWDLKEP